MSKQRRVNDQISKLCISLWITCGKIHVVESDQMDIPHEAFRGTEAITLRVAPEFQKFPGPPIEGRRRAIPPRWGRSFGWLTMAHSATIWPCWHLAPPTISARRDLVTVHAPHRI